MQLEMKGNKELVERLENARVQMAGPEMRKALKLGGNRIKAEMVALAPVLESTTPGSSSLDPGVLKANMRVYVTKEDDEVIALIGPNQSVEHVTRWVEYGHRDVHGGQSKLLGDGRTRGPGIAGEEDVPEHPFLRPAYEASITEAGEIIATSLKQSYKEVLS